MKEIRELDSRNLENLVTFHRIVAHCLLTEDKLYELLGRGSSNPALLVQGGILSVPDFISKLICNLLILAILK